ncbi:hypothetical protein KY307_00565 [Candidatus Woesearchaeota archaeon]|nr:hypothetical protein [Candidatus Woesearchaeota archaeon]
MAEKIKRRIDPSSIDTLVIDLDGTLAGQITLELVLRSIPENISKPSFFVWLLKCGISYLLHGKKYESSLWSEHLVNGFKIKIPQNPSFYRRRTLLQAIKALTNTYRNAMKILITRTKKGIAEQYSNQFSFDYVILTRNKTDPETIKKLELLCRGKNVLIIGDSKEDLDLARVLAQRNNLNAVYFKSRF